MPFRTSDLDLATEIARVRTEIAVFRDECLPAMLGTRSEMCSLSQWREAARRLADGLPLRLGEGGPMDRESFREFMFMAATPSWRCEAGRIRWRIELFTAFDDALVWYPAPKEEQERLSASADWPREHRIEIEARLLSLGVLGGPRDALIGVCAIGNALCMLLPWLADADPDFARIALDKETWRTLVVTNHSLTANERDQRLRLIDGILGRIILNNALLHVLGALANNHFLEIREYLRHPNLLGGYTYHMPRYLFAVLFEKVATLRPKSRTRYR